MAAAGSSKAAVAVAAVLAIVVLVAAVAFTVRDGDDTGALTVRKDVKDLTPAEKQAFVDAVLKAKATPDPEDPSLSRYDVFVAWHRDAFACANSWDQGTNWAGAAHNSPTFLPWHREYLMRYEQMLREVSGDPTLTLPYWDWTDAASTAAVFADDFMGGEGDPQEEWAVTTGPFRKGAWEITIQDPAPLLDGIAPPKPHLVRRFATFPGGIALPTAAEVSAAIDVHGYDHAPYDASAPLDESFRNTLEGWREAKRAVCDRGWVDQGQMKDSPHVLHNAVHIWTGGVWPEGELTAQGTMAYNTSPNDPVFFIHHANIDRIFAAWEAAGATSDYLPQDGAASGWNGNDTMWPWFDRTIDSWFDTARNGYVYATYPALG